MNSKFNSQSDIRLSLRILCPFRRGFNLSQQRIDAGGLLLDRVAYEVKRGSMAQIEREAKLLADVRRRAAQRDEGQLVFMLIAGHCDKHTGVTQIVGNSHVG